MSSSPEEVVASEPAKEEVPAVKEGGTDQPPPATVSAEKDNVEEQLEQAEEQEEGAEAAPPAQEQPGPEASTEDNQKSEDAPAIEKSETGVVVVSESDGTQGSAEPEVKDTQVDVVKQAAEHKDEKVNVEVPVKDETASPLSGTLMKRGPKPLRLWQKRHFAFRDEPYELEQLSVVFKKNVKRPFIADLIKKKDNLMARIEKEARERASPTEAAAVSEDQEESKADTAPGGEKQSSDLKTGERPEEMQESHEAQPSVNLYEEINRRLFNSISRATVTGQGFLFYYKSDSEEHRKCPLGLVDLLTYRDVEVCTARPHSFFLRTENREYVVAANSDEETKKWIEAIKSQVAAVKEFPSVEDNEKYIAAYSKLVSRDFHKEMEEVAEKSGALAVGEGEVLSASEDNEGLPEDITSADGGIKAKDGPYRRRTVLGLFSRRQSKEGTEKASHGEDVVPRSSEEEAEVVAGSSKVGTSSKRLSLGVPNPFKNSKVEKVSTDEPGQVDSAKQGETEAGENEKLAGGEEGHHQNTNQGRHYVKFLDMILHGRKEKDASAADEGHTPEGQSASREAVEPTKKEEAATASDHNIEEPASAEVREHEEGENLSTGIQRGITKFFRRQRNAKEGKPSSDDEHAAIVDPEAVEDEDQAQVSELSKEPDTPGESPAEDTERGGGMVTKTAQTILKRLSTMARRHRSDAPANVHSDMEGKDVDVPAFLDVSQAAKSGYLQKQSLVIRNYERRFFVLHKDGQLYYYRVSGKDGDDKRQQPASGSAPSHKSIVLDADVTVAPVTDTKKPHVFELVTKLRSFRLAANSDLERDEWIAAIEAVKVGSEKAGNSEAKKEHSSTPELPAIVSVSEIAEDDGGAGVIASAPTSGEGQVAA